MKMFRITLRNNVSTGYMSTMAEDEKAAETKAREWFATNFPERELKAVVIKDITDKFYGF